MLVPLVNAFYEDYSRGFDYQRCINWYPVLSESGDSKNKAHLVPTPGSRNITSVTPSGGTGCRGMYEASNGRFFGVWGNTVYEILSNSNTNIINSSTLLNTEIGSVSLADNGEQLVITTGSKGYIYTFSTSTFAEITDTDFPLGANQVIYHNGYFICTLPGSNEWSISNYGDGSSWNGLDYATITSSPDTVLGLVSVRTDVWIFGKRSIEVWQDVGNADFPYQRINGASQNIGTLNPWTIQKMNDRVYWLGSSRDGYGAVFRSNGYDNEMISTDAINAKIGNDFDTDTATAYTYKENGHFFYVINIVGLGTFCYDEKTGLWHERAYLNNGVLSNHRSTYTAFAHGVNWMGYNGDNNIYRFDNNYYYDNGNPIKRLRTTSHISQENKNIRYNKLELEFERGTALPSGQGSNPQVMMRYSDDGGYTWSGEDWRSLGLMGQYSARARWHSLGMGRDRIFEFSVTDPIKVDLIGGYMDIELLIS